MTPSLHFQEIREAWPDSLDLGCAPSMCVVMVKQATVVRKNGSLFNLRQDGATLSRLPSSNFPLDI